MNRILIIITTESSLKNAEKIAKLLIEKKVAACVSLKEITSTYFWDGEIESTNEIEINIKSTIENRESIIKILRAALSYDLPQIIFNEFNSELDYFNWIKRNVI
tara:strand:+ start:26201 stop:26512 length:312 start_codon:yes stop_codon:yes gene_type:complete